MIQSSRHCSTKCNLMSLLQFRMVNEIATSFRFVMTKIKDLKVTVAN